MKKKKIVIVDDNPDTKEPYELMFASAELELTYLTDPLDAVRYLSENRADAVLIDLAMPNMDGLELARQIRLNETGTHHRARLAWFTGMEISDPINEIAVRYEVEKKFSKPAAPDELIYAVKTWLNNPSRFSSEKKSTSAFSNQNGAVMPTLVTAVSFTVVLIIVISIYNRVLHNNEETAAYRYSEKRNEYKQIKEICENNFETDATLQKWLEQNNIKPPPGMLIQRLCVVTKKEEKE